MPTLWARLTHALAALSIALTATGAAAQADVRGAKDHPLLTRYPNSYITEFTKNYSSLEFAVGKAADGNPQRQAVEGNATVITYFHKTPASSRARSSCCATTRTRSSRSAARSRTSVCRRTATAARRR